MEPKPLFSNLLGVSVGTLAGPQCFRRRAGKRRRRVDAVVVDVHIDTVLKMLRELEAAAFAPRWRILSPVCRGLLEWDPVGCGRDI